MSETPDMLGAMAAEGTLFVGRHAELAALRADAERARDGATAVLVAGDAGVGKSRLLQEHLDHTPLGRAARGNCLELGGDGLPFAPFIPLLRGLLRTLDHPREPTELGRLLPELGTPPDPGEDGRGRLFAEVLGVLEAAAEPDGLAVAVEDLHWADQSSRDLLVFLLHNLDQAAVQVLLTFRGGDLHRTHPLRRLMPELERLPRLTRVDLGPLSRAEVAEQVAGLRGSDRRTPDLDLVYARTGGNPFFVESFMNHPDRERAPVPSGPRGLLLGPYHGLPAAAQEVVKLLAVGGERVPHALLLAVADRPEAEVETTVRAAIDANIVRTAGEEYVFRHALLAESVQEELLPGERTRLHRRYAQALLRRAGDLPKGQRVTRLAHHSHAAHDQPLALESAWQAAETAKPALAYAERLRMLERVLELWEQVPDASHRTGADHVDVLLYTARAAAGAGFPERGAALATAGLTELLGPDRLDDLDETTLPQSTAVRVAWLLHVRGVSYRDDAYTYAVDDLRRAVALLPADHEDWTTLMTSLAAELTLRREFDEAVAVAGQALTVARTKGDRDSEAHLLATLGLGHGLRGERQEMALRKLRHGRDLAREVRNPHTELRAIYNTGTIQRMAGRLHEALETHREGVARERELRVALSQARQVIGVIAALRDLGRLAEAERVAANAARGPDAVRSRGGLSRMRALVAYDRGDLAAMRRHLDEDARALPDHSTRFSYVSLRSAIEAMLYKAEGRWAEARERIARLLDTPLVEHDNLHAWDLLDIGAEVWHQGTRAAGDDTAEWAELRATLLRRAEGRRAAGLSMVAMRDSAHALLCTEPERARAMFDANVETWRAIRGPVPEARAFLFAAEAAAEHGDRAGAAQRLATCRRLATGVGARLLLRWADELSARTGLPTGDDGSPRPAGLTAREIEVVRLVAQGHTNRQIAEKLVISAKTVSVHVSNALAKLDAPNRGAAAAKARELGIG